MHHLFSKIKYIFVFLLMIFIYENKAFSDTNNISLNSEEKEFIGDNKLFRSEFLLRKALLEEMKKTKISKKDKFNIELIKQEVEVNLFLQLLVEEKIKITKKELMNFYEEKKNTDEHFKNKKYEDVEKNLYFELLDKKSKTFLDDYYTMILNKYNIKEKLN